jgi:hypothetical protein
VLVGGKNFVLPTGTTHKFFRTSTRNDAFNVARYVEVMLTIAEAAA